MSNGNSNGTKKLSKTTAFYLIVIVALVFGTLGAMAAIQIANPTANNQSTFTQVIGFVSLIVTSLFNAMKTAESNAAIKETHKVVEETKAVATETKANLDRVDVNVDGKMNQLLDLKGKVEHAEGKAEGVTEASAVAALVAKDVLTAREVSDVKIAEALTKQAPAQIIAADAPVLTQEIIEGDPRYKEAGESNIHKGEEEKK